ncbi:14086_t:CDS:2 [Ambispora leptoticha]|uniref:14086_t:CDS:1 n=1 Tax=Ambispora leptoticha TaxID=144679 RepID=A0A9N8ZQJ4_9GLOM|nr:14086_t:CDS:2 [Ambispora leptoticha]
MEQNTQEHQPGSINDKKYFEVHKQWNDSSDLDFDSQQQIICHNLTEVYETPLFDNNNTSISTTSKTEFPLSSQRQNPQESTSSFSYSSSSSPDWDLESICSTASSHSTIKEDDNNNQEYYYQNDALSQNSYTTITSDSTITTPTQSSQFQPQKSRYIFFAGQIIAPGFTFFSRVTQKSNNDTNSISQKRNCKSISKRKSVYPVRSPDKVEDGTGVYATCCVYEIFQNEPLKLLDRVKKPTLPLSIAKRLKSRSGMKKKLTIKMSRGVSLIDDLKSILNNQQFSDIRIKCSDNQILYGSRIHLAARSEVFNRMLNNGMSETDAAEISFQEISSTTMKIVLEFLYTGDIDKNTLNFKNVIDVLCAANFLLLSTMETRVSELILSMLCEENDDTKAICLYSSIVTKYGTEKLDKGNSLIKTVYERVIKIPFDSIPYNTISFDVLKSLLSQSIEQGENFVTPEYQVFRYVVLWGANNISSKAFGIFSKLLPKCIEEFCTEVNPDAYNHSVEISISDLRNQLLDEIGQLLPYINLKLISIKILGFIIDPLKIFAMDQLMEAYRFHAISSSNLSSSQRTYEKYQIYVPQRVKDLKWRKEAVCYAISEDGSVVESKNEVNGVLIRTEQCLTKKDIYEWKILIEKMFKKEKILVGLHKEPSTRFIDLFVSNGPICSISSESFKEGDVVTVHVDMISKTCAFSINSERSGVSFHGLPDKVYPFLKMVGKGKVCTLYN